MNVQQIARDVLMQAAETVDQWRIGAIGLLLVVVAACLFTVGWIVLGGDD